MRVMKNCVVAASLFFAAIGCTQPVGENKKTDPVVDKTPNIERLAYEACQKRDLLAGQRLKQLAADVEAGRYPYDGPLLDQIKKINTEITVQEFADVEKLLRDSFDPKLEKLSPKKVAAAIDQYGSGRARAGSSK